MVPEGIRSEDLCKIRTKAGDKKTSGVDAENKLNEIYGTKYRIRLDHQLLTDHGVFYPQALYNDLIFEVTLTPASQVVREVAKNPKRVAEGTVVAEKTRQAREAQKKAAEATKAAGLVPNNQPAAGPAKETSVDSSPKLASPSGREDTKNILTTTQWLSIISILVSIIGIYYKREEIKKKGCQWSTGCGAPPSMQANVDTNERPPAAANPQPIQRKGLRPMG